ICNEVDNAADELAAKIDLATSSSPATTPGRQPPPSFSDIETEVASSPILEATQSNDDVHTHSPTEESENVQQAVASATTP
ncbi:unnamed protein product, partial [Rotaria magnacalcarata]